MGSIYVSVHILSHELSFQGYNKWASKIRGLELSRDYSLLVHYSLFIIHGIIAVYRPGIFKGRKRRGIWILKFNEDMGKAVALLIALHFCSH